MLGPPALVPFLYLAEQLNLTNVYYFPKNLSLCHELWFSYVYIFTTKCRSPLIFQPIYSARVYNLSLKYLRFTPSGWIDKGMRNFKFVAQTQLFFFLTSYGLHYSQCSYLSKSMNEDYWIPFRKLENRGKYLIH